jgi:hypothetical protein
LSCIHYSNNKEVGVCTAHEQEDQDEKWLEGNFLKIVTQLGEGVCPDGSKDVCTYKMRRPSVEP